MNTDTPICINHGCNTKVTYTTVSKSGKKRWVAMCGSCARASQGRGAWKKGVTPWKTGRCSNADGHLGFSCPIDYEKTPHFIGMTDVDHKNGDHTDNQPSNLDELCPMCHKLKGKKSGDYRQLRTGERKENEL